jgi:oligoribonuclease (3'-5' exoribonuclease)
MFLFADTETDGVDLKENVIIEVAFILAGKRRLDEYGRFTMPVYYKRDPQKPISPKVIEMHTENGLWEDCLKAPPMVEVESASLAWLNKVLANDKGRVTLAGSNIGFDQGFFKQCMPRLFDRFHYRTYDVSVVHETFYQWAPTVNPKRKQAEHINPQAKHRALDDALWSLEETRKVRELLIKVEEVFKPQAPVTLPEEPQP